MIRLSPQDLDRIENERLDCEGVSTGMLAPLPMFKSRQHAVKDTPPLRNNRHGWQPTLEDMERK